MPEGAQGGRKGTAAGQLLPVFVDRISALRLEAQKAHNALQGRHQRQWATPEAASEQSTLAIADLHKPAFDRTELNDQYTELTKSTEEAGTVGDVIANKLQLAYVAAEERAYRSRHTTLCRAFCHGHGRRIGQGHGAVWSPSGGLTAHITDVLQAGASG